MSSAPSSMPSCSIQSMLYSSCRQASWNSLSGRLASNCRSVSFHRSKNVKRQRDQEQGGLAVADEAAVEGLDQQHVESPLVVLVKLVTGQDRAIDAPVATAAESDVLRLRRLERRGPRDVDLKLVHPGDVGAVRGRQGLPQLAPGDLRRHVGVERERQVKAENVECPARADQHGALRDAGVLALERRIDRDLEAGLDGGLGHLVFLAGNLKGT